MQTVRTNAWMPPRTRWGEAWRAAVCLLVSGLAWGPIAATEWQHLRWLFWADLVLGLASFPIALGFRRRRPMPVAMILTAFAVLSASSVGPEVLATVSVATRRRWSQIIGLGVFGIVTGLAFTEIAPETTTDPRWVNLAFSIVATIAVMAVGMYIGSRRELIRSLRDRAEDAERQQELRMEQARARERERIAREMHDILAHRISLITMHAGALTYRDDLAREQVTETAALIASTSHEALVDLREVLGALRGSESVRPQPTLDALSELVADARTSGMRVDVENELPDPAAVPARLGRAAYRMVQEALTNASKHEPDAPVRIRLSGAPGDGLTVAVRNGRSTFRTGPALPGSGLGLVGMRERFELSGGRLDVYDAERWFTVEGWLPWTT